MEDRRKRHELWITFGLAIVALMGAEAPGLVNAAWTVGTPIVTYWGGPNPLTDAVAQQAVSGGFNLVWAYSPAELNVAQAYGLRAMWGGSLDDATITQIRNYPALYAYYLTDEPLASAFAGLSTTVAHLRTLDPNHVAYIDLPANYADPATQLGTSDYPTYLSQYVSTVHPSLLSYNHYQFMVGSDTPDYLSNLAIISHTAQQSGVPFMNIVQACIGGANWRLPNANELRYLAYTTLAYGGQGISYFNYGYSGGIQPPDVAPSATYTAVTPLNREFKNIATRCQGLKLIGDYLKGYSTTTTWSWSQFKYVTTYNGPPGTTTLPSGSPFDISSVSNSMSYNDGDPIKGVLFGLFDVDGTALADTTFALIENLDYTNSYTYTVSGPGNLSVFNATTGVWTATGSNQATLSLSPGGGALVGLTSLVPLLPVPEPDILVLLGTAMFVAFGCVWKRWGQCDGIVNSYPSLRTSIVS